MYAKVLETSSSSTTDEEGAKRLTGVSNAMQAMILGHNGAFRSGLDLMNSNRASEASSPPMLMII